MSDRALFAAFQKVKAQVDDAVSLTREREARARAEEEKARAAKKTRVVKAAETRRAEAGTASISASAFSATGGFGAALADAAKSSGASFRMAAPAKSRGGQPVTAPKAEPSAVRKHAQMSPSTKAKEAQGKRHDAKADRAGRRPSGEQAGIRNERSEGTARQSGRTHSREGADRQKTVSSEAPKRRLSYEERRNPVPPFTLMPGLPVSERGEEVAKAIR
ncbi:MAG: ATP-dependent helicase, partial [Sutterella wadsworthensis]